MSYENLKTLIRTNIKPNGNREITGSNLQQVLISMVNSLGDGGYIFKGIATTSTDPGSIDYKSFYFATEAGTYTHFGDIVKDTEDLSILKWDNQWTIENLGISQSFIVSKSINNDGTNLRRDSSLDETTACKVDDTKRGQLAYGRLCETRSSWATALGNRGIAGGIASFVSGRTLYAKSDYSQALGYLCTVLGNASMAILGQWVSYIKITGAKDAVTYDYIIDGMSEHQEELVAGNLCINYDHNDLFAEIISVDKTHHTIILDRTLSPDEDITELECVIPATVAIGGQSLAARGVAKGNSSWAINRGCLAKGTSSLASGESNITENRGEFAGGKWNKSYYQKNHPEVNTIATIGNGTAEENRSNALELKANGDLYVVGVGGFNGKNSATAQPLQAILQLLIQCLPVPASKVGTADSVDKGKVLAVNANGQYELVSLQDLIA